VTTDEQLANWKPRPRPARVKLDGRYCRLEPLEARAHGDQLFEGTMGPGAERRFRYLFDVPSDRRTFEGWLAEKAASDDPLFFAVLDKATGRAEGRQGLMRIVPEHGVIEIGNILWGPAISRTRVATEALYLHARYVFDDLGYRRFEWKCNVENAASMAAARRFGFTYEGIWRQHMVQKGKNRDSAWFAMTDGEWPIIRKAFEQWLEPSNFDAEGRQKTRLGKA
jgi:RimJ/RimL family protein N-acetyltransferase